MTALKVTFTAAAVSPDRRPSLPRSGACAAPLPAWHPHEAIMLGGYTEERAATGEAAATAAAAPPPAPPRRAPTLEAWTFSSADGGRWHPVQYAPDSPLPQPRLTSQAAVVGEELWLMAGWDPSAPPDSGAPQFLNDVWALDLKSYRWRRVEVEGEEMPRISRFAAAALPDGRLLLHTHRCDDHVLALEPRRAEAAAAAPCGAVLSKLPVQGATPGVQSPPSRGLHSLTAAAAPPKQQAATSGASGGGSGSGGGGPALYVYGGAPQSGPMYGDLWVLDVGTKTWQQLKPEGPTPQVRCSHGAGAVSGGGDVASRYLIIIGGSFYVEQGRLRPLDDVIVYDTQTNRWLEAEVEGPRPSARNAAVMVPLRAAPGEGPGGGGGGGDRFVLHGGWRPFVETFDDTYIVTVTPSVPKE